MWCRIRFGALWIGVYLLVVLAPSFLLLIGPTLPGRGFWRELSVALGFAGLSVMGLQFLLTARFRSITCPYGIDVIYRFHRQVSILAFVLIALHPLILFTSSPATIRLLNLVTAPWRARAGVIAVVAVLGVIVTSVWRKPLRIRYEPWRISHGALATLGVLLSFWHILGVGYYTSIPLKRVVWIAYGAVWVGALLWVRVVKPFQMLRRPYVVEEVIEERGDSWTLVLRPEGHKGMRFQPGQFAWMTVWSSPFSFREHPFSFSSSAMTPERLEITIKELGDFTSRISEVQPGTRAYLDGPYGTFTVDGHRPKGFVFIAGGVGITPIMSILRTLADRRDSRPLLLVYGNPTWEGITFREELEKLTPRLDLETIHVLERPPEGWQGETGYVTPELLARYLPKNRLDYEYYVIGPEVMIDSVEDGLSRLGIPLEQYHSERFEMA